jgi:hypothetical protein
MSVPLSEAAQEPSQRSGKKVLILFTDGDDNSSALNASTAVARAKGQASPVYHCGGRTRPSKNLRKLVDDLSQRTGGAAYEVKKPGHIERVFHEISEDLRLSFAKTPLNVLRVTCSMSISVWCSFQTRS